VREGRFCSRHCAGAFRTLEVRARQDELPFGTAVHVQKEI
jgi:hypothetical protein